MQMPGVTITMNFGQLLISLNMQPKAERDMQMGFQHHRLAAGGFRFLFSLYRFYFIIFCLFFGQDLGLSPACQRHENALKNRINQKL